MKTTFKTCRQLCGGTMKTLITLSVALLSMIVLLAGCNKSEEIGGLEGTYESMLWYVANEDGEKTSLTFLPNGHMIKKQVWYDNGYVDRELQLEYEYRLKGTTIEILGDQGPKGMDNEEAYDYFIQGDGTIKDIFGVENTGKSGMPPSYGVYRKVTN